MEIVGVTNRPSVPKLLGSCQPCGSARLRSGAAINLYANPARSESCAPSAGRFDCRSIQKRAQVTVKNLAGPFLIPVRVFVAGGENFVLREVCMIRLIIN